MARVCEGCNKPMPRRLHREQRADGRMVCEDCMTKGAQPAWATTAGQSAGGYPREQELRDHLAAEHGWSGASIDTVDPESLHHEHIGLHELGTQGVLADAGHRHVTLREAAMQRQAHESSDDMETFHCPWCGSGQITGNSDGTITCSGPSCARTYTVRLQPTFPAMPQTIDGAPFPPGQPGADAGAPGDEVPGQPPAGAEEVDPETGLPIDGPPGGDSTEGPPAEDEDDDVPAFLKGGKLRTAAGVELPYEAYVRHLAVVDSGYAEPVLEQVREAALRNW